MTEPAPILSVAARIADEVLFPAAARTDASELIPAGQLDLLAAEGFYGLAGPAEAGGLGLSLAQACQVVELLASGCLATTFVWLQHHSAVRAAATAPEPSLRAAWLEPLCRGIRRAGIALGGAQPGPPRLRARPASGGYLLDGTSPWVTGWGMIDTLYAVARDGQDNLVAALLDAGDGPTLSARPLRMVSVNASRTVELSFDSHFVPGERVTSVMPHAQWLAADAMGLRMNGSLALGLAARCCQMIGPGPLDAELACCRGALDAAGPAELPAARATAAALAMRTAAALVTVTGSRAVLAGEHPQRLAREALFLLVFGSRPLIKQHLTALLTSPAVSG